MRAARHHRDAARRGNVLPLIVLCLGVLVGIVALVVDGGLALAQRRQNQAAVDLAALAGAAVLYQEYPTNQGQDLQGNARAAVRALVADNGVPVNASSTSLQINVPPASGPYAGRAGCVEVVLTTAQPVFFWGLVSPAPLRVTTRAVARGCWSPFAAGILIVDEHDSGVVSVRGNGALTNITSATIVNSNSTSAVVDTNNSTIQTAELDVTGLVSGAHVIGPVFTGVHPTPDPLAYLPGPGEAGGPPVPGPGVMTTTALSGGGTRYDFYPGQYLSLPSFSAKDQVVFHQASSNGNGGVYYLSTGGLSSQGANLTMAPNESGGVMLYVAGGGPGDSLSITGNPKGTVNLSGLTSGPYTGLVIFQARGNPAGMDLAGNGDFNFVGTIYAPGSVIQITGNGLMSGTGSQVIAKTLGLSGNGTIQIAYSASKVARTRQIGLVE